jgi:hypothetical protein
VKRIMLAALVAVAMLVVPARASAATTTYLGCGWQGDEDVHSAPRNCFVDYPNLSLAAAIGLGHLTWTGWGHSSAYAHGRTNTKAYDPWTYVRVRASGHSTGGPYQFVSRLSVYTRLTVKWPGGQHTWRMPSCRTVAGIFQARY